MKSERIYPRVLVTAKGARWVDNGHPWIYESDVADIEGAPENGALVSPATPTIPLTRRSGGGASATRGTTARRSWARTCPAAV